MRDPNYEDAKLALRLYDLRRETELRKARSLVGRAIAGQPWEKVEPLFDYEHEENAHLRQVVGYWENAASFVLRGIFHPAVYLDTCGEGVFTFVCFKPHLERIRGRSPTFLAKTEQVAREIPAVRERVEMLEARMAAWQAEMAQRKPRRARAAKAKKKPAKKRR